MFAITLSRNSLTANEPPRSPTSSTQTLIDFDGFICIIGTHVFERNACANEPFVTSSVFRIARIGAQIHENSKEYQATALLPRIEWTTWRWGLPAPSPEVQDLGMLKHSL